MSARRLSSIRVTVQAFALAAVACGSSDGKDVSVIPAGGGPGAGGSGGAAGTTASVGGSSIIGPLGNGGSVQAGTAGSTAGGAGGGGGRSVMTECAKSEAKATDVTVTKPADIIIAVDTSGSMDEEIEQVQDNLNAFSQQIIASGIDVRVILIGDASAICIGAPLGSGSCPNDTKAPNYFHIDEEVDSNDGLNVIHDTYSSWRQHLRPEATKSFFAVTDDDATDGPLNSSAAFRAAITALDAAMFAEWTMNSVHCFTECVDANGEELAAAVGEVWDDLVADTMGVKGDLCLQNFQPVFDALATSIIDSSGSEIACTWPLPAPPAGQAFSVDLVNIQRSSAAGQMPLNRVTSLADCTAGGYYFDSLLNPTTIEACPSTCTELQNQEGGAINVTFGCETVGSCVASGSSQVMNAPQSCEWTLPVPPNGQTLVLDSVNVRYTSPSGFGSDLGKVADAAGCGAVVQGWHYDDNAAPQRIIACPQTCEGVQAGGAEAKIDVLFGCASRPAVPR